MMNMVRKNDNVKKYLLAIPIDIFYPEAHTVPNKMFNHPIVSRCADQVLFHFHQLFSSLSPIPIMPLESTDSGHYCSPLWFTAFSNFLYTVNNVQLYSFFVAFRSA